MRDNDNASSDANLHGTRLTADAVYDAIRHDGEDEIKRQPFSLWWSGVAAGFVMSLCVLAKGFLHGKLPDSDWVPLIDNLGYALGFVIVVLGRMQLFTETTITAVLPVLSAPTRRAFGLASRLWAIVFVANLIGTFFASIFIYYALATPDQLHSIIQISAKAMHRGWLTLFFASIPAGFIVAAIVWMLPNGRGNEFWLVLSLAYVIGLGNFPHVIVGSVEAFVALWHGVLSLIGVFFLYILPVLLGNIIGGTLLFSVLAYGQVRNE